jgi:uncharacterized PurR-regulated membrane protein YhhQ (DUF165 family)
MAYLALAAYIATIWGANWAIATFGVVPVWPGLVAPAGVFFAGLAFTLRDLVQETSGKIAVLLAILLGAVCSATISGPLALASGITFLVSETLDFLVYTPLRGKHWLGAVGLSNLVGLTVDSALFLWLAFGSLEFLTGHIVGKLEVTVLTLGLLVIWRTRTAPT